MTIRTRVLIIFLAPCWASCSTGNGTSFESHWGTGVVPTAATADTSGNSGTTDTTETAVNSSSEPTGGVTSSDGATTSTDNSSDGSSDSSDGSSGPSPGRELCGDSVLAAGEECDDGNSVAADGCEVGCVATRIQRVVGGNGHTCVIFQGGQLKCWGYNARGELGYGHTQSLGDDEPASAAGIVDVGGAVQRLAMGLAHVCALLDGGTVRCWGAGGSGRLGAGNTGGAACLDAQQMHSCAVAPQCCIGDDELPGSVPPVDVGGVAEDIVAGGSHTCVLLAGGLVRCWGNGSWGRLGLGNLDIIGDDEQPADVAPVSLGRPAVALAAAGYHTCALLDDGGVRCWGSNNDCELGVGLDSNTVIGDDELPSATPPLQLGGPATQIWAGGRLTCARLADDVHCWGGAAVVGVEAYPAVGCEPADLPPPVIDVGGVVDELSAGGTHTCARLADATMRCWGLAGFGALGYGEDVDVGDGPGEMPPAPITLDGIPGSIAAGLNHTCVVLAGDRRLKCWGHNSYGELGYGHMLMLGDEPGEMPPPDVPLFE